MVAHANLTGSDLHEPKGADSASAGTVYVSDGAGSGNWKKVGANEVNTTEHHNFNKTSMVVQLADIGTASGLVVPLSFNATLTKITAILYAPISGANETINVYKKGGALIGTFSITNAGSAKGDTYTLSPVSNNTFVPNDYIEIVTLGSSTGPAPMSFLLDFNYT